MPSRKDATSKRLHHLFDESRRINFRTVFNATLASPGSSLDTTFRLEDDLVHKTFSRIALQLSGNDEQDAVMLRAFEAAGLDHRNPFDWRQLLSMFSEAHFGNVRTKPVKWDVDTFIEVLKDYVDVKRSRPAPLSDTS